MKNKIEIEYEYFPVSKEIPAHLNELVNVFCDHANEISSFGSQLDSNQVLSIIRTSLQDIGFLVERGKSKKEKLIKRVPCDDTGDVNINFEPDAIHERNGTLLEVETGATAVKNALFRNLFRACLIPDIDYLAVAVNSIYNNKHTFDDDCRILDALYMSKRLQLPLKGILLIGY